MLDLKTLGETYTSDPNGILPPGAASASTASARAPINVVLVCSVYETVPKTDTTALFDSTT